MNENESLLDKARRLAEARNHKLLPFVRQAALAERVVSHVRDTLTDPVFGEQRAEPVLTSSTRIHSLRTPTPTVRASGR